MLENFEFLQPPANLQKFVKYLWVIEVKASEQEPYFHRAMVDGCAQLLFAFRGGFYRLDDSGQQSPFLQSALVAQTKASQIYRITENFGLFGVCLYPFSIPYLIGVDGHDFIDRYYAPGEVFEELTPELERVIIQSERHEARQEMIGELFKTYFNKLSGTEPAVFSILREMFHAQDVDSLSSLVQAETMSSRHLQRQFKRYTGYRPKQLVRILRVQLTLSEPSAQDLSGIAAEGHYYDQSHLTNEFQALAGTTPNTYFTGVKTDVQWRREGVEVAFFQSNATEKGYPVSSSNEKANDDASD